MFQNVMMKLACLIRPIQPVLLLCSFTASLLGDKNGNSSVRTVDDDFGDSAPGTKVGSVLSPLK